ncbi:hypothetical protein [Arsenicicoccus dermatophilus]|uniref:hypothetical protein n=1 Tax=Arsenicicoccus dermatophilus TaxID=1076331 RepID=UPI0039173237
MSTLDDFVSRADADAFQAALDTGRSPSPDLARLLETVEQVRAIPVPAPDPAFVARLADRLHGEAAVPATPADQGPSVVQVRRAWPKALAGAAAGVIVATTGLGVAAERALPGDLLYGVRGVVDGLSVQLAGSDGEQGRTLLAQARRHIGDTETLSGRPDPEVDAVRAALRGAAASVESGDAKLFLAFDATRDPSHLVAVRDFTSWSEPALKQLRRVLPAAVSDELASLESTVASGASQLRAKLAACGDSCRDVVVPRDPETATTPTATSPAVTSTSPSAVPALSSSAGSQPLPTQVIGPVVPPTTRPTDSPAPPRRSAPRPAPTSSARVTAPPTRLPSPPHPRPPRPPATVPATVRPPAPPAPTATPRPTRPGPRPTVTGTAAPTRVPPRPHPTPTPSPDPQCPPGYVRIGPFCVRVPQGPGQPTVTVVAAPPVVATTQATDPTASASEPAHRPRHTGRPRPEGRPVPVRPAAPVFAELCLPGSRIVTLPTVRGLGYSWDRATLGDVVEVTVRARPLPGHVLADGAASTWVRLYLDCGRP